MAYGAALIGASHAECRNVILIGPRGAGKTTIGRLLAHELGWQVVDTDEMVTTAAGITIREVFEQFGEPRFRALERDAVARVATGERQVISVGGGAVIAPENRAALRAAGLVVWLTADPDTLHARIAADPASAAARPALTPYAARDELAHLLAARGPLYAELAAFTVDTTACAAADAVRQIVHRMQNA